MCHPDAFLPVSVPSAHRFLWSSSFAKATPIPVIIRRLFQDTEACVIILHILDNRFLMCGNCIHISFSQKGIDQFPVSKTDQISQFGDSLIRPVQKDTFRFGCGLDSQVLSRQVAQFIDITVLIYSDHLTACYVRPCPAVIVKAPFHRKTSHDTVNLSALHQFFFLLPVDLDNLHLISHSFECFRSQFYIYSRRYPILIQIIVWWIVVTAEGNNRLFRFFFSVICIFTPCQGDR